MDLSKLPRLSESEKHAPPAQQGEPREQYPALGTSYEAAPVIGESSGAAVWLSAVLGIIFMLMGRNFARFLIAKLTGQPFHTGAKWNTGPKAGQEVEYFELLNYSGYSEMGIFLFGLAMVLEALVLAFVKRNTPASRALLVFALVVTVGMTLFNLVLAVVLFGANVMPIQSLLAVAFGGYMAHLQWQMLRQLLAGARA